MWRQLLAIIPILAVVSLTVIVVLFAVIYKVLPEVAISWRDVLPRAFLTAALIGIYLRNSAIAGSFGAAASLVALSLRFYYSSQVFFFGAEFTRLHALRHDSRRSSLHA
jgi:membrane protein